MWVNFFGAVNTLFICISLLGVAAQLRTIWQRKTMQDVDTTGVLSLNMFTTSFLAYYAFFVYGMAITPFNHWIVWPRLAACILVGLILWELYLDRRTLTTGIVSGMTLLLLLAGGGFGVFGQSYTDEGKSVMSLLMVCISVALARGYGYQIKRVLDAGDTGALDKKMSQFILMMDVSTFALGCSLGFADGWPLLLIATTSGVTKVAVLYLFHWVNTSPIAAERRAVNQS